MPTDPTTDVHAIALVGFPLDIFRRARQHTEALLREFAIVVDGGGDNTDLPRQLLETVERVQAQAAGVNTVAARSVEIALARGDETVDVQLLMPTSMAPSARQYLSLLDEVDAYCAAGDFLTLASTPELRRFRRWYLGEIAAQIDGRAPVAWRDFVG